MIGWMYILECADGSYYTGSTNNLDLRFKQHQNGEGANHSKKHLPVKLVYSEEFQRIDEAFNREKQVQGWSRKKKEALINGDFGKLSQLSRNYTQYPPDVASTNSATERANDIPLASTSSATERANDIPLASTSSATLDTTSTANYVPMPELVEGKTIKELI